MRSGADLDQLVRRHVHSHSEVVQSARRPARILDGSRLALNPGARLGPYEILSSLGAGGMGEVYRARDTKLKRHVAIKILPSSLAADSDRLARFQREAEVLASLNHPNIAAIYGLEDADGVKALVMELVEGEDLSQRIARGPIPIDEALPIAKQIAEALEAAHEQGIIHRDLKPANIKVRPDGAVKVLDFGLAKALEPTRSAPADVARADDHQSRTDDGFWRVARHRGVYGPERAQGGPVDKRADIWAFGCVLYEMLTGRRAVRRRRRQRHACERAAGSNPTGRRSRRRCRMRFGRFFKLSRQGSPASGWRTSQRRCSYWTRRECRATGRDLVGSTVETQTALAAIAAVTVGALVVAARSRGSQVPRRSAGDSFLASRVGSGAVAVDPQSPTSRSRVAYRLKGSPPVAPAHNSVCAPWINSS